MILSVKVKPNSRINKIQSDGNNNISVKITSPPHEGKANEALIKFLAKTFDVPKSHISIISGLTNPNKRIDIPDIYTAKINFILTRLKEQ